METLDRLAEKLRAVNFDRSRLSDAENAAIFDLARRAGVELPRAAVRWPSSLDAAVAGGALTLIGTRL